MSLITRTGKRSRLTIAEMDGNLEYLESNGFVDGEYVQSTKQIPSQPGAGEIVDLFQLQSNSLNVPGATGTYIVSPTTDGRGEGAEFELVLISNPDGFRGGLLIDYDASSIINGGFGYVEGDNLTIRGIDLGGPDILFNGQSPSLQFIITEASLDTIPGVPATKTYINVNVTDTEKSIYLAVNEEIFVSNDGFTQIGAVGIIDTPFISLYQSTGAVDAGEQAEFPGGGGIGDPILIDGGDFPAAGTGALSSQITVSTGTYSNASINLSQETVEGITDGAVSISANRGSGLFASVENITEPISSQIDLTPDSLIFSSGGFGKFDQEKSTVTLNSTSITIDTIGLFLPNIPVYEDDVAATDDGYQAGGIYKTSTGELRIVVSLPVE